jgi:hypothetical protein
MSNNLLNKIEDLVKALELGSYNATPGSLVQGSALQVEDVSPVMHNVTFQDKHIKLQKDLKVEKAKGQLIQFNRQLSYGTFGGSAQHEGQVGVEDTSDYIRSVVPMAYYSHIRRVTLAANFAETQDGVKAEDREAQAGAKKIAGDVEWDVFGGKAAFSNAGVFDGNPLAFPDRMPGMVGLDPQIRQSDTLVNTQDLMFDAFGSNLSVVIAGGGTLTQSMIEDAWIRGLMNLGSADVLYTDPLVLSAYSKNAYAGKERIVLGNSGMEPVSGADISKQAVSGGVVKIEPSQFLRAQTKNKRTRNGAPGAPTIASIALSGGSTSFLAGEVYTYYVTAENEIGESAPSATSASAALGAGNQIAVNITPGTGTIRYFNVYRSTAGGGAATCKLVGKVAYKGASPTVFTDLNNRKPGGVTGFLVEKDTMALKELAGYSRLKLAVVDLTQTEAHFRFLCLAAYEPRKNVLIDSLLGSF